MMIGALLPPGGGNSPLQSHAGEMRLYLLCQNNLIRWATESDELEELQLFLDAMIQNDEAMTEYLRESFNRAGFSDIDPTPKMDIPTSIREGVADYKVLQEKFVAKGLV